MKKTLLSLLMTVLVSCAAFAQTDKPEKAQSNEAPAVQRFYKLDFVLREIDGNKEISKRNYTITARTNHNEHLRMGTRVPVMTGPGVNGRPEFQYMDVGVTIETLMREEAGVMWADINADLTSMAPDETTKATPYLPPLMRQGRSSASVPVTAGKSVLVFSADEPTSSRKFELTVSATQMK